MKIAYIFLHRISIAIFDVFLFIITAFSIYRAAMLLYDVASDANEIELLLDGIGIIFVAYGVALEERETLMKFFKLYPALQNEKEEHIDKLCHFYGLWFLLLGLFMEVGVEIVKIPYAIFDVPYIETVIFGTGSLFAVIAAIFLVRHVFLLLSVQ
jgi:hypothetical protein